MTRRSILISIRGSLWFTPVLLLLLGAGLAVGLIFIDRTVVADLATDWPEWLTAGPEAARQLLSAITGSMITVTGVVFSITIVSLSLASNQFSPRVLRTFMRDRVNQLVLGVLVGVFIYGLIVLQSVRSDSVVFVPQTALWGGIVLSLVALGFLIAFLHHTAVSIQASEIVARLARETMNALRKAQREHGPVAGRSSRKRPDGPSRPIASPRTGYVQDIALDDLEKIARRLDVQLVVEHGVGDFAIEGRPLVHVHGSGCCAPGDVKEVQGCFGLNVYRTIDQDPAFGVRQIVDIALKALSPGINDTTTAIHCIDYLGAILHEVVKPADEPAEAPGDRARGHIHIKLPDVGHYLDLAFHEIRQNARGNVSVLLRLSRSLRGVIQEKLDDAAREAALHHFRLLRAAAEAVPSEEDRAVVLRSLATASRAADRDEGEPGPRAAKVTM